jgi:hypothetical protein
VTATVTVRETVPQVSVYVALVLSGPTTSEPAVARAPLQPPEAVHELTFWLLQDRVAVPPAVMVVGLALNVSDGGGGGGGVVVVPEPLVTTPGAAMGWVEMMSSSYQVEASSWTSLLSLLVW